MSLTINILKLHQVNGASTTQSGIVGTVEYEIISNDTQRSVKGFANLDYSNINSDTFVDINELTADIVKSWVIQCIGTERMAMIEEQLTTTAEMPIVSYKEIDLPWA